MKPVEIKKKIKKGGDKTMKVTIDTEHARMDLEDGRIKKCIIRKTERINGKSVLVEGIEFECNNRNTAEFVCRLGINEIGEEFARIATRKCITLDKIRKQLLEDTDNAIYEYSGGEYRWMAGEQSYEPDKLYDEYHENPKLKKMIDYRGFVKEFEKQYREGTYDEYIKSSNGKHVVNSFIKMLKHKTWEEFFEDVDSDTRPGGFCSGEFYEWVNNRIWAAEDATKKKIMGESPTTGTAA